MLPCQAENMSQIACLAVSIAQRTYQAWSIAPASLLSSSTGELYPVAMSTAQLPCQAVNTNQLAFLAVSKPSGPTRVGV
jgi:hypothetical protein